MNESDYKIFGWQADSSGCGYYRIMLPMDELARRGYDVEHSERMSERARDEATVIVGQRVCKPGPTRIWKQLHAQGRARLVYEIDDDLFNIDPSNAAPYQFYTDPEIHDNLVTNIRLADVVTVSTEPLADVIRAINPNVVITPNRIPASLLKVGKIRNANLTIGWAGSGSHSMDWADAAPQVGRFLWRNSHVRFHLIGGMFESQRNWPLDQVNVTKWLPAVEEYYHHVDFDVALAPLRPHVFNRSKSAIKALEAAALGIPILASAAGPYESFVQHGTTGYLIRQDHEWVNRLRELSNDHTCRIEMGIAARSQAEQHTVEANLDSWQPAWNFPTSKERKAA